MSISLRPLTDADLDALFAWQSDPRAVRMAAFTREDPTDRAAFDAHYRKVRGNPSVLHRAIECDGELAGEIAAFTIDDERELTYWIDPSRWGRGIASEALRLLLALETQRPLYARVAAGNRGSRRVLEKAGFEMLREEVSYAPGLGEETAEFVLRLT